MTYEYVATTNPAQAKAILYAVTKLSPSTLDLLLRSPEAVEACVNTVNGYSPEFVRLAIAAVEEANHERQHRMFCKQDSPPCNDCYMNRLKEESCMDAAIALLPKRDA